MYQKPGSPFLYDETTGDVVGLRDVDGGEDLLFATKRCTWANRPAENLFHGRKIFVTDAGQHGAEFQYSAVSSRWRAVNGSAVLKGLGDAVTGITNVAQIPLQTLLPAGMWQLNDTLRVWLAPTKSGTTDQVAVTFRVGVAGTSADTAVLTLAGLMAAANQSGGYLFDFKLASLTTVQRVGAAAATTGSWAAVSSTAPPAAVTIPSAAANALYFSAEVASSGATNTVGLQAAQFQLITP